MSEGQTETREVVAKCLTEAVLLVAAGSVAEEAEQKKLLGIAASSISFPNNNNSKFKPSDAGGKPQDIEIRLALSLFHRWRRASSKNETTAAVEIVSDMGVTRQVTSPRELAELILLPLETACRREGIANDVRSQRSGLIGIVTVGRAQILRQAGKLPCPHCNKWCQGEKGLWWHQHQNHKIEYSEATEVAAASTDTLAIIPYDPRQLDFFPSIGLEERESSLGQSTAVLNNTEPLDFVKEGNLGALKQKVNNGYIPSRDMDKRGASPLMWAAGSGHLDTVRYLREECGCDPNQPQRAKRSFSGRTPLHWAARNGHLEVVKYLVIECLVDIEAATMDGTTAFCWASWQGNISVMEFLFERGCNVHSTNSFGCNAVLWAAQGNGDVITMEWLQGKGCDMIKVNNNGHGVLHKAAQRGQQSICPWFVDTWVTASADVDTALRLVGPDAEGYCPSDLAGVEGYCDLAKQLATMEMDLIASMEHFNLPSWLTASQDDVNMRVSGSDLYRWERFGGQRRMRSKLLRKS